MGTSILDLLANYNPSGFATRNQQSQATLEGTRAQTQQTQEMTKGEALKNQLAQRDLRDQGIMRDAISRNPTGDPEAIRQDLIKSGISAPGYMGFQTHIAEMRQKLATAHKDEVANELVTHQRVGSILQAIDSAAPEQREALAAQSIPDLQKLEPGQQWNPADILDDTKRKYLLGSHGMAGAILSQRKGEAEIKNLGSEADKNTAAADESRAKAPGETARSERERIVTDLMKAATNGQQTGQHPIDAIMQNDPVAAKAYKADYDNSMRIGGPDAAKEVLHAAAAHMARISLANNPEIRAGEVAKSLAIEQATNPLKLQQARAQAGATAGVREAMKLDQDYVKSAAATEALGKVLDLTASGNKAAGAGLPVVSAITLNHINDLKRLNRNEIVGVGGEGAGNLFDRVEGFFGKAVVGTTTIPENVQNDMRALHQALADNAYQQYTTGLSSLSQRSGAEYKPTVAAPNIRKSAVPEITSQVEYDKLPKGARYTSSGVPHTKQ